MILRLLSLVILHDHHDSCTPTSRLHGDRDHMIDCLSSNWHHHEVEDNGEHGACMIDDCRDGCLGGVVR